MQLKAHLSSSGLSDLVAFWTANETNLDEPIFLVGDRFCPLQGQILWQVTSPASSLLVWGELED